MTNAQQDFEYRRIQRAAAQSMANQGYTVECQGLVYSPASSDTENPFLPFARRFVAAID